ncbi:MAG: methyltransferase domain-containing protein [Bacteroidota bacterium]|nr:methyltransferase domain-containing protein [Bacteroidota bacterium]
MKSEFTRSPERIIKTKKREIFIFDIEGKNIDQKVVNEFGDEWLKFYEHDDDLVKKGGEEYFDILTDQMINANSYVLDIGCGTGRWTKYLAGKVGFIEAVDPSNAIFAADKLLGKIENVRLLKASIETLPFADETFDFVMSIGVLHHIPNTRQALIDCVKKVKKGGYFFVYLYYNLDRRGPLYKALFHSSDLIRKAVSRLPGKIKHFVCDGLAIIFYMPFILVGRFFKFLGFTDLAKRMPLHGYQNRSFFMIRNDTLDRFGTRLEQRFSKKEVIEMMEAAGLTNIVISPGIPYYHAVGKKK